MHVWLVVLCSAVLLVNTGQNTFPIDLYGTVFESSTVDYGLAESEAACEVMRDLWPRNVFHSRVIHLHFLWVVTVLYSINSNSLRCLDSSRHRTKHTQTAWNDIHRSNFVSTKDQVSFMLSLTVTEPSRITFFSYVKYGNRLFRNDQRSGDAIENIYFYLKSCQENTLWHWRAFI